MENRKFKQGFTLLEMLIVVGIIAVLMGMTVGSIGSFTKKAKRAKDQEIVSNAASALNIILQKNDAWPVRIANATDVDDQGSLILSENVCPVFVKYGLLGLAAKKSTMGTGNGYEMDPTGPDRFGLLDSDGAAIMKKMGRNAQKANIQAHYIRFAVDTDLDGVTEANVGGEMIKVRATAICWAAGPDGKVAPGKSTKCDDVRSWQRAQVIQ